MTSCRNSVPTTASSMPISPSAVITAPRAATGELSHLMDKTTQSAAMIYAACQKESLKIFAGLTSS